MNDKSTFLSLQIISFLGILIYPLVLFANLMALLGRNDDLQLFPAIAGFCFVVFSSLYPVTFLYSLSKRKQQNINFAVLPLGHIGISILLFVLWTFTF